MLVDTGAEETLLNLVLAKLMGFGPQDLQAEDSRSADGGMEVYRPKNLGSVEFQIRGKWYRLPSLQFGERAPVSLLGRDMIFTHFELHMSRTHFALIPLSKKKRH